MKTGAATKAMLYLIPLSLALFCAAPAPHQPTPMRVVASSSESAEPPIKIPLIDPQYPTAVPDAAAALVADVNAERAKHGLSALVRDETLDRFARAKAVEMAANGYFGHTDPNGITFQDRMHTWRWPQSYAAENIAFDWDEPHAHTAFMNSPPHAQNVLDGHEARIGVAVVNVGDRENFYVEDFSAK